MIASRTFSIEMARAGTHSCPLHERRLRPARRRRHLRRRLPKESWACRGGLPARAVAVAARLLPPARGRCRLDEHPLAAFPATADAGDGGRGGPRPADGPSAPGLRADSRPRIVSDGLRPPLPAAASRTVD